MRFNVLARKTHHWLAFAVALPVLVIIGTGLLLQVKKQWTWVQPAEQAGTPALALVGLEEILASARTVEGIGLSGWTDVHRVDVRPGDAVAKVTLKNGWEVQVDLGNGRVLQSAYRRSDLIEAIHDGSWFGGDLTKFGLFLPAGMALLVLWLTGLWMVWLPFSVKRKRRHSGRYHPAGAVRQVELGR